MFDRIHRKLLWLGATLALLVAPAALAQEDMSRAERELITADVQELDEVEVERPIDELPDDVEPQPEDPDVADTALVFTNTTRERAWVKCVAFDKNGNPVGRSRTAIPGLGVRYVLASDMSNGTDFVGQVQCAPHGKVMGSVVFLGPGLTDLPVRNGRLGKSRIRFPLVAHY